MTLYLYRRIILNLNIFLIEPLYILMQGKREFNRSLFFFPETDFTTLLPKNYLTSQ